MNKPKTIFTNLSFIFVCLLSLTNIFAQTENPRPQVRAEPNYEVMLHVLIASNKSGGKNNVPQSLSGVVKKLKGQFAFSDYRLDSTYFQRIGGSAETKDVSNDTNSQMQGKFMPIFTEFSLVNLSGFPGVQGKKSVQFQSFRYGQRIPVQNSSGSGVVNYEQIGISIRQLNLPENIPTVVGSLATSNPDELMFLVMTVTSDEQY